MAHKKGLGSTQNVRDSEGKRLGVKLYGGQRARNGSIIVRQRGSTFHPGPGTRMGKDYTIYAVTEGIVRFGKKHGRKIVMVVPEE